MGEVVTSRAFFLPFSGKFRAKYIRTTLLAQIDDLTLYMN